MEINFGGDAIKFFFGNEARNDIRFEMGRDGSRWVEMGRDGLRWFEMVRDWAVVSGSLKILMGKGAAWHRGSV